MANLIALSVATAILVMIPGPNVALIVANSIRYGFRMGSITVLGTTLGVRTWNEPTSDLRKVAAAPAAFWRGCVIAAINPKTLLFNAAFLPQFVVDNASVASQLALVAVVFLTVLLLGDMIWAMTASSARRLLDRYAGARNRMTGGFLVMAGVGLALSRR